MTQEQKYLLLRDLCARLPYGVKVNTSFDNIDEPIELKSINIKNGTFSVGGKHTTISGISLDTYECKPYLFPLSSMTEAQKKEYEDSLTYHDYVEGGWVIAKSFNNEYIVPYWLVDFCNKNHFDYRNLIGKNLAIDCTNLGIYK